LCISLTAPVVLLARQRDEQYSTLSQFFSHFLRHEKGKPHTGHTFVGNKLFFTCFPKVFNFIPYCPFATSLLDLLRGESSRGQKGPFSPTLRLFSVI
jgi:hypothetical protein